MLSDTSEKSKDNSREVIDSLGGDDAHYGNQDQPRTKTAAEEIDGSRAMLKWGGCQYGFMLYHILYELRNEFPW